MTSSVCVCVCVLAVSHWGSLKMLSDLFPRGVREQLTTVYACLCVRVCVCP